ncbi:MAG TPA: rod shape-determining protein MreD [Anaerolineae bacterium]|nr:rod shape-determining protein MreD [Anaerolineae bacterium]
MNPYLYFGILFGLTLLQSTVMPKITVLGVHPDLVLMAVTSWSLLRGAEEGMLWALISGVVLDLLSGAPFGIYSLALLTIGFAAGLGQRNMLRVDILAPIVAIPLATLAYLLITMTLLSILGWEMEWGARVGAVVLPSILVNSLGMPFVYLPARLLHRRVAREEISW